MEKSKLKELVRLQVENNEQLNQKPVFIHCAVRWDDEDDINTENYDTPSLGYENVVIAYVDKEDYDKHSDGSEYPFDDKVFYYIFDLDELLQLIDYENGSEFHLTDYFYCEKVI